MKTFSIMKNSIPTTITIIPFLIIIFAGSTTSVSDICACTPKRYEFTFDFSLGCSLGVTVDGVVTSLSCIIDCSEDPNVADCVPVAVQSIDILEFDQNFQKYVKETINGNYKDGDTFQYTSVVADDSKDAFQDGQKNIPQGIELNIIGVNQFGQSISNVYHITFSNDCNAYPVLSQGEHAGWTRFVSRNDDVNRSIRLALL